MFIINRYNYYILVQLINLIEVENMTTEQKKVITSFTTTEKMLNRLQELKETSGISISWLINSLLSNHLMKIGGEGNEQ